MCLFKQFFQNQISYSFIDIIVCQNYIFLLLKFKSKDSICTSVASNCSVTPIGNSFSKEWCSDCQLPTPFSNKLNTACIADDFSYPGFGKFTNSLCTACSFNGQYAHLTQSDCIQSNCQATPTADQYTNQWCSDCQPQTPFTDTDKSSFMPSDCSKIPTPGSYTTGWCSLCSSTGAFAKASKKACIISKYTEQWYQDCETNALNNDFSGCEGKFVQYTSSIYQKFILPVFGLTILLVLI